MKVLVVGCGSIGKRHIRNLIELNIIKDILIFTKNIQCLDNFEDKKKIKMINSINDIKVDFAVISNETNKHMDTAILLADQGIPLFIEKPLSHSLDKVEILKNILERKKIKAFIAYNLRFLGAIECIEKQLSNKAIGDLYFAKIEVGQYLPSWRPDADYRLSYSASKGRGGGVSLDLSHEIDYMRHLFSDPCSWKVVKTRVSKLEIDSDDIFEGIYLFPNDFICNVHLDYLQTDKKREIRIVGSKGIIICDFIRKYIELTTNNGKTITDKKGMFDINRTYVDEMRHFIEVIKGDKEPKISLSDGIRALELLEDGNV